MKRDSFVEAAFEIATGVFLPTDIEQWPVGAKPQVAKCHELNRELYAKAQAAGGYTCGDLAAAFLAHRVSVVADLRKGV